MPSGLKQPKDSKELILDPAARIKKLTDYGSSVEIDVAIPIRRYYRSGTEMERQVTATNYTVVRAVLELERKCDS